MTYKVIIFLVSLLHCSSTCNAQRQIETLLDIIGSDTTFELRQKQIDSFLKNESSSMAPAVLADCYHELGNKWYFRNWRKTSIHNNLDSAITFTRRAYELKLKLDSIDRASLKKSLFNLGFFQTENGAIFEAIQSYSALVDMDDKDIKTTLANFRLGQNYMVIGDYHKAIERLKTVLFYYQGNPNQYSRLVRVHISLAETYAEMGYNEYAKNISHHLTEADFILDSMSGNNLMQRAEIAQLRGNLMVFLNKYEEAIDHHKNVLDIQESHSNENLAFVYNSLGVSFDKLRDTATALHYFNKSLFLNPKNSALYENMGDLYVHQNNVKKGLTLYKKAIALTTNRNRELTYDAILTDEDLELSPDKTLLLSHLVAKANGWLKYYRIENKKNYLKKALGVFNQADKLTDIIKRESTEFYSKVYWRGQSSKLYAKAVETCFLLDMPEQAFFFMERNKAILLLEDLTHEEAKKSAKLPTKLAQREFELRRGIFLLENHIQEIDNGSPRSKQNLSSEIWEKKRGYKRYLDSLNTTYPDYAKFKKNIDVLSFKNLKANYITENKTTLHYILNEEDGYGLLTTSDSTELFRLNDIPNLNKEVEKLTLALSNGVSDLNNFKTISNTVFQKLFPKNVYDQIKGKQLTIIPDYTLQQIPFETLVVNHDELTYLCQEVDIGYAYSISLLEHNQEQQNDSGNDFLGIAPVTFDNLKLHELYFSKKELTSIAGIYPGQMLLNGEASKTNFIKNANDAKIIHLATHADIGDGDNPWIAFNDSKMYLKEIYATKIRADMVVLSACNTSTGELKRGEGVMSLARGFFYSGAKSVVSTLWPVADEAGKDILINFYKNLNNGLTKSKALQKAKLDYLTDTEEEELKHPYYWAGFVVLGDNSPVSDEPISPYLLLGFALLGTGILVFGYKKIKVHRAVA